MEDKDEQERARAHWRVRFTQSLLETHRSLRGESDAWEQMEAILLARLEAAQAELERLAFVGVTLREGRVTLLE
jgi:hypothetical protein